MLGHQDAIEQPFELAGALGELAVPRVASMSRQRNSSSAMLSAASTARRSESPVGVDSAAARIFSST